MVDRKNTVFWVIVMTLLGASAYFGVNAEARRRLVQGGDASLTSGELVSLSRVIDGDTVVVQKQDGRSVAVRLLGIKAFDGSVDKDPASHFGRAARDALTALLDERPAVVELHSTPKDKHGRVLASLEVDGEAAAKVLVRRGLVLVYTLYPFDGTREYLREQEAARAERIGLWSDPQVAQRADLLRQEWERQAK